MDNLYWYSEGYVHFENESICEVFGTIEQQKEVGEKIVKHLNNNLKHKLLYFSFGLIFSLIIILFAIFLT